MMTDWPTREAVEQMTYPAEFSEAFADVTVGEFMAHYKDDNS